MLPECCLNVAVRLKDERGEISLEHMHRLGDEEVKAALGKFKGQCVPLIDICRFVLVVVDVGVRIYLCLESACACACNLKCIR